MMKVRQTNKGNSPDRVPPKWTVLRWINLPSGLAQALKFTQGTGHKTRGLAGATKKQGMRAVSPPPRDSDMDPAIFHGPRGRPTTVGWATLRPFFRPHRRRWTLPEAVDSSHPRNPLVRSFSKKKNTGPTHNSSKPLAPGAVACSHTQRRRKRVKCS